MKKKRIGCLFWFVVLLTIFSIVTISVVYIYHKIFVFPKEKGVLEKIQEIKDLNKNGCENKLSSLVEDVFFERENYLDSLPSSIAIINEDLIDTSYFIDNIMKNLYQTNCSQDYKEQTIVDIIRNSNNFYIETISILKSANNLYNNGIAELSLIKKLMTIILNDIEKNWKKLGLHSGTNRISIMMEKLFDDVPMKAQFEVIIHLFENYNFKYKSSHILKPDSRSVDYHLLKISQSQLFGELRRSSNEELSLNALRYQINDELSKQIINNKKISFEGNALRYQILLDARIYDPDKLYKLIDERKDKKNYQKPKMKWETMQRYLSNKKIMIIDSVPTVFIPEEMRKSSYNRFYISKLMDLLNDGQLPNNFEDVEILIYSADTKFEYSGSYMGTNKNAFRPIVTWRVKDLNSDEILSEKIIRGVPQTSISINPKNQNDFKPVYGFMPNEEVYNEIQKTLITGE